MIFDVLYLNGGKGTRLWPLTLDYINVLYSKSILRLLGQTLAESQLLLHSQAGARHVHIITQYDENREGLLNILRQEKGNIFEYDRLTYTHPERDLDNTGSATAVMQALLDQPHLDETVIVLPNDNHIEYNVQDALRHHKESGALITILSTEVPAYHGLELGVMKRSKDGTMEAMKEKAGGLEALADFLSNPELSADTPVAVSGGAYIIDAKGLRELMKDEKIREYILQKMSEGFDIAKDFIPFIMSLGKKVQTYKVTWADMGGLDLLMKSVQKGLNGEFPYLNQLLNNPNKYATLPGNVHIHLETLDQIIIEGSTLREKIERGLVKIGPNVFMGRNIKVYPGAEISYTEVGRDSKIGRQVIVSDSYLSPNTSIHENAEIYSSITGHSAMIGPYAVLRQSVIGHINVPTGVSLYQSAVWPETELIEGRSYNRQILFDQQLSELRPKWYWPTQELLDKLPRALANL